MASIENLGQHVENYVDDLIKAGRYKSRSEVLREGVLLLEERERQRAAFNEQINLGIADVAAGRVKPIDDVFNRLVAKYGTVKDDGAP